MYKNNCSILGLTKGGIRIDCDSKMTDINAVSELTNEKIVSDRNNVFGGLLKTIVLNPNISISFAGGAYYAKKAIDKLYEIDKVDIQLVKSELLKSNKESLIDKNTNNSTDFLIASIENQPLLYKISNGEIETSNQTHWIGDIKGFNMFQQEFIPNIKSTDPKHIFSVHSEAFQKVVESGRFESIGGFQITVHKTKFGLEYMLKSASSSGKPFSIKISGNEMTTIPLGNAQNGAFSINYLTSNNPFQPAVGIYFPMGNFGTLYYPKISRKIIFFKDVNPFEFVEKVKNRYKLKLCGMVKNGDYMTMV